ncbi:uncharacterized protein LOC135104016 [Scylla paramamosain]|uniref:uncharacterized protein LOC135104016 n=1 Tax=Scylla paramamosain TaxID=85552 RepID=UPI003083397E
MRELPTSPLVLLVLFTPVAHSSSVPPSTSRQLLMPCQDSQLCNISVTVVSVVETLVDRTVALPCKAILHPPHDDTPNLLLFYRHPSNIPFFSYDARTGDFWRAGTPKTRDAKYEDRVSLNLTEPRQVHLNLQRVSLKDGGDFTCRVDFLSSPSLTSVVKLHVYANPSSGPTIRVGGGGRGLPVRTHSDVGPFYEGEMLNLSCSVTGGEYWSALLCLPCLALARLALPCFEVRGGAGRGGGCFALPWSTGLGQSGGVLCLTHISLQTQTRQNKLLF